MFLWSMIIYITCMYWKIVPVEVFVAIAWFPEISRVWTSHCVSSEKIWNQLFWGASSSLGPTAVTIHWNIVELFSGEGQVSAAFKDAGMNVCSYDLKIGGATMDFTSVAGFLLGSQFHTWFGEVFGWCFLGYGFCGVVSLDISCPTRIVMLVLHRNPIKNFGGVWLETMALLFSFL